MKTFTISITILLCTFLFGSPVGAADRTEANWSTSRSWSKKNGDHVFRSAFIDQHGDLVRERNVVKPNGTSRTTLTTPKQIWFQTTWESPGINSSFIAEKTVNRQTGKVDWKRRSTSWNMAYWRVTTPRSPGGTAEPVIAQMKASGDHPVLVLRQLHNLATAKNCEMEVTISGVKIKASPTLPFREVIAPLIEKYPGFLKEL